jgi:hypothetical protein
MKPDLTIDSLCSEARIFGQIESQQAEPLLYGVTDGKAVGTYFEHKFQAYLRDHYLYVGGSSALGIDFPELNVDVKVTRISQPQSSSPFRSAKQKIYGLGYSLLVFVYEKADDHHNRVGRLNILHTTFVEAHRTADFQTTTGIRKILGNDANVDDIVAFLLERRLPVDDVQVYEIANEILLNSPEIGYLTISNALQWRLQYSRAVEFADQVEGIRKIL